MATFLAYARFTAPLYQSEQYRSVVPLREYLARQEREEHVHNKEIDFFISMVETVDQLRFHAAELYTKQLRRLSQTPRGPLPLPWCDVVDILFSRAESEPPTRLISYLAENQYALIETLVNNMRKVLKQRREMTPISRTQKLDSTCLRWFIRQPGISPEQKAGSRQKLLAVVKTETYDTLENRVFKDFLKKCCTSARQYCDIYHARCSSSKRYLAVKKLMNLIAYALKQEHFAEIGNLYSVPIPNYVLQYDSVYSKIWAWYQLLMAKTRLVELLWPHRHAFTADFFKIVAAAFFRFEQGKLGKPLFHSNLRIRPLPGGDGLLTDAAFYNNLYQKGMQLTELRDQGNGEVSLIRHGIHRNLLCCYREEGISLVCNNQSFAVDLTLPPEEAFANLIQQMPC